MRRIVFDASYLVLGLGDVYLGAPVATPLDPRHRLVTTKYNPARTWTPENAVGIGGAYLCVYGMEGPGGYQFVGRTCQMWNRFHETAEFPRGTPWLLRFFDQIRFFPCQRTGAARVPGRVPARARRPEDRGDDVPLRRLPARSCDANQASIEAFRARQRAAFVAERERWASLPPPPEAGRRAAPRRDAVPPGRDRGARRRSPAASGRWPCRPATRVAAGDRLVVLETMKMETPVLAPAAGVVVAVCCAPGALVRPGQTLVGLRVDA